MLQAYVDNPTGHWPMKSPNPQNYCNSFTRIDCEEGKQDLSLAEYHRVWPAMFRKRNKVCGADSGRVLT